MKKMKKMLALMLAMLMALSLVACGDKGGSSKPDSGKSDGPVEVLVWSAFQAPIDAELQAAADAFNASQDKYKVKIQFQGQFTEIFTKLTTTLNQKDLPELTVVSTELAGTYAMAEGLIRPLSHYCSADDEVWAKLNGNLKYVWGNGDGDPIYYPYGNSLYGSFVNAEIFEAAGIDPYTALTSTKGLYEACKKLVDGGYCKYGIGVDSWGGFVWYALAAAGIQVMDNNNGRDGIPTKMLLDTPEVSAALYDYFYYFRKMQQEGLMVPYGSSWGDEVLPAFANGSCAVATGSIAAFIRVETALAADPFAVAYVPCWSAVDLGSIPEGYSASGTGLGIVENGDEEAMEGAWEFIKFTSNPEFQESLCLASGYLPVTKEGYESAGYQDFVTNRFPAAAKAFELQQNAAIDAKHINPLNPVNNACQDATQEAWSMIMTDLTCDINEVIATMQKDTQIALDLWLDTNT
ncbi:MAG: extracellular solute-binding protein [Ruminococcaceae bacterium]|nr:extracellular solute-binding protein [Oscillospiraceae bacterium]